MNGELARSALAVLMSCLLFLAACSDTNGEGASEHGEEKQEDEGPRGANGGRLIASKGFQVESKVDEGDGTPRFRLWVYREGKPIDPEGLRAKVRTTRLGGAEQVFPLAADGASLLSTELVPEPHSFDVAVAVTIDGQLIEGSYPSYETRVELEDAAARAAGVETAAAGPATIRQALPVYGSIIVDPQQVREIRARFPGVASDVAVKLGDRVKRGQRLTTIESNESLQRYAITSPIDGQVVSRQVNAGDAVGDGVLFTVTNLSSVWAEFAVFRRDLARVRTGAPVTVMSDDAALKAEGKIAYVSPIGTAGNQSLSARVPIANPDGRWVPGLFVKGEIVVGEQPVALAVRNSALQRIRDLPVVFEQVGTIYEARFVELGAKDREQTQVLGGIEPGARYVIEQSYLIKADIEKSGAEHSH